MKRIIAFFIVMTLVVTLSTISVGLWNSKKETMPQSISLTFSENTTLAELANTYSLPKTLLKDVFALQSPSDLEKTVASFGMTEKQLEAVVNKKLALEAEHASKDWKKILVKFLLWFAFMGGAFVLMRKRAITPKMRIALYAGAVLLFGIILGSDPSPMGTVKDAVHLLGAKGVIFPPRIIALAVFLLTVFLANKFICSWGCQIGALQDLIFRLNRDEKDRTHGGLKQYKLPFAVTNGIRMAVFVLMVIAAFGWGLDIFEAIDPFKIYKPESLALAGIIFVTGVLFLSLFIYRPWCSMFCPFGMVGWLVEKLSLFKIRVNYSACIACGKCAQACPNTAMDAILKQNSTIPDCFSCGNCLSACPTGAVSFSKEKREAVPAGKFDKLK